MHMQTCFRKKETEYVNMNVERDWYAVNIPKYMMCLM